MPKYGIHLSAAVAVAAFTLVGCAGDATPSASAQYDDDASITTSVQAAVISVPGIHANNVQVSTKDAVVTLKGTAENTLAARNAVQAARQVAGVKKVDYDIQVP